MKYIFISLFLLASTLYAQDEKHEKIKALKVGFLTEQLSLTSQEAQSFWPIYNEYDKTHNDLKDEQRNLMRGDRASIQSLSEENAKLIVIRMQEIEAAQEIAEINYINNLKQVLTYKKIIMLFQAEKEFRRKLLHRLRNEKFKKRRR